MLLKTTETFVFIPVASCLNLSTSQKGLSAPCPKKYFLYLTNFRVVQLGNLGLVLCTRDGSTDSHISSHTGAYTCMDTQILQVSNIWVTAIFVWGFVDGSQKMHIPFHTGLVSNQIWDKFRVKTRGKKMFSFLGLLLSTSISHPPTEWFYCST